jgi:hypothetical protein
MMSYYSLPVLIYVIVLSTMYFIGSYFVLRRFKYIAAVYDSIYRIVILRILILTPMLISLLVNNPMIIHSYLVVLIILILLIIINKYVFFIGGSRRYYYVVPKLLYILGDKWFKYAFKNTLIYLLIAVIYSPISLIIVALLPVAIYVDLLLTPLIVIGLIMLLTYVIFSPNVSYYSVLVSISIDALLIAYILTTVFGVLTNISLSIIFVTTYVYLLLYLYIVSSVTMTVIKGVFNNHLPLYLIESKDLKVKNIVSFIKYVVSEDRLKNPLLIIIFSKPPNTLWNQLLGYFRKNKFKELNIYGFYNIVFSHYVVSGRILDIEKCTIKPCIRVREASPNRPLIISELTEISSKNYTIIVIVEDILDLTNMLGGLPELIKFIKEILRITSKNRNLYFLYIHQKTSYGKMLKFIDEKIRLSLMSYVASVAKL